MTVLNNKIIVLDNFFPAKQFVEFRDLALAATQVASDIRSYLWNPFPCKKPYWDYIERLFNEASKHFNLDNAVGFEMWKQDYISNGQLGPHVDCDEPHRDIYGWTKFVTCTIVVYVDIALTSGGEVFFPHTGDSITPHNNRVVMFSPAMEHDVKPHPENETRKSVIIAPFDFVPEQHK